jgi:hypothetical protein
VNSRLKDIPRRIFLDSSALQTLQTYGGFLYESEPLSPRDRIYRDPKGVAKLKALRWIMQVAERAPDPFRTHGRASVQECRLPRGCTASYRSAGAAADSTERTARSVNRDGSSKLNSVLACQPAPDRLK